MAVPVVRIGFRLSPFDVQTLDPANINTVHEGLLLTNLYSGLVEYDKNGNLQAGIAKRFFWDKDKLIFEFDGKVVTASGHSIDANDAAISIKRILKLKTSTHTNINQLLCSSEELNSIFDECDNVKVVDGKLIIKSRDAKFNSFILQSLAAGDMSIVPASAIDKKTLKLTDLTETSGPYYIESRNNKSWNLRVNKKHFLTNINSPQKVELIAVPAEKTITEMFVKNEIDLITTTNNLNVSQFDEITQNVPDVQTSKTGPIKLFMLQFSLPSLRKTSAEQRLALGNKYKKLTLEKYPLPIFSEEAGQFFLQDTFGQLTKEQSDKLKDLFERSKDSPKLETPLTFYWYNVLKKQLGLYKDFTELDMIPIDETPFHQPLEKRLDLALVATDVAFEEDIALLGYNFTQGTFGLENDAAMRWLDVYQKEPSKARRAERLRELHYRTLKSGIIIPIAKAPYTALGRNGFSVDLSPLFATTNFAEIRRN